MLGLWSFSDQLQLEVVGMKEYDKGKSLGRTCRKAFSNMQTSTQLQCSGGGERGGLLHVFISDIIYTLMEACLLLNFCFPK